MEALQFSGVVKAKKGANLKKRGVRNFFIFTAKILVGWCRTSSPSAAAGYLNFLIIFAGTKCLMMRAKVPYLGLYILMSR